MFGGCHQCNNLLIEALELIYMDTSQDHRYSLHRVSAPEIPSVKTVTISIQAGSNKVTIDFIWEVSDMFLRLTKDILPRRYCKRNDHIKL